MRQKRADVLPGGADKGRLGVVGRVPGAHAELEPALCVDRQLDRPEPPGMVMLGREVLRVNRVPYMSSVRRR